MSYILDALRKSQQEHHLGEVPTLGSVPPQVVRGRAWGVIAAVAGVALLVGGGFGLALLTGAGPRPDLAQPGDDTRGTALVAAPSVAPLRGPSDTPLAASPAPAALAPQPVTPQPQAMASPPIVQARLLADLAPEVRASLPDFELNVHIHSPDPRGRFVFLNNSRYREGEQTREGARVEAITAAGVVLDYHGTRFRLGL